MDPIREKSTPEAQIKRWPHLLLIRVRPQPASPAPSK